MGLPYENQQKRSAVKNARKATKVETTVAQQYLVSRMTRHMDTLLKGSM